ncbi:MAG: DUF5781 family protein [Conexivisphaerales archaeon]
MSRQDRKDEALEEALNWALQRMKESGYAIRSEVKLVIDPKLPFMGYAKERDGTQYIVASEWALDSEMLGGFLIHELAHIYASEKGLPSHDSELIEEMVDEYKEKEGLNEREAAYLIDSFSHLQNIIVDDIVFDVMNEKERRLAQKFFESWVTERPVGDPLVDASSLVRNAFAIASVKRRGLFSEDSHMKALNEQFLSLMKNTSKASFNAVETFLEKAKGDLNEEEFRKMLRDYFELVISIARDRPQLEDLR